jgi:hypothetical protein
MAAYPTTKFERAVSRAIARENAEPQGLPRDVLAEIERDILDHPKKYPELRALLTYPRDTREH